MRRSIGVFLVLIISFCSSVAVLFLEFLFVGKILTFLLIHAGVFFYLSWFVVKPLKEQEKQVKELSFQLEEKRIQLKDQGLHDAKLAEKKNLKEKASKELPPEIKHLCTSYHKIIDKAFDFFKKYQNSQKVLDDELASVEENYKSIKTNIDKTFKISDNLATSANKAFSVAEDMQKGIASVTESLGKAILSSNILFDQSAKIGKIIEIIREIAEKTHVLSINASIVSARAGTHGKAFDVVAREIRNLASESDGSIHEIEEKVSEIQGSINSIVGEIDKANLDITNEKDVLMSVVGSLQGITLGVEVLRAVSKVANEKSFLQNEIVINIIHQYKKLLVEWEQLGIDQRNVQLADLERILLAEFNPDMSVHSESEE